MEFFKNSLDSALNKMIQEQIIARGIHNKRVIHAFEKIPRHLFLPENLQNRAYTDEAVPIDCNQTISQPYMVAAMLDFAELKASDRVLEIGTGSGYQTALISQLAAELFTIERIPELLESAKKSLSPLELKNIQFKLGDGYMGWKEKAPFDAIIVTAASPLKVPEPLIEQLDLGGRLIIPLGIQDQILWRFRKTQQGEIESEKLMAVRFVPFVH